MSPPLSLHAALFVLPQRKLLAVYLHHDDSILTNVFCSQILCSETVVSYLTSNFVTWAWDLTSESNKARYCHRCTRSTTVTCPVRGRQPDPVGDGNLCRPRSATKPGQDGLPSPISSRTQSQTGLSCPQPAIIRYRENQINFKTNSDATVLWCFTTQLHATSSRRGCRVVFQTLPLVAGYSPCAQSTSDL